MNDSLVAAQDCLRIKSVRLKSSQIYTHDEFDFNTYSDLAIIAQQFKKALGYDHAKVEGIAESWAYRFFYAVGIRSLLEEDDERSVDPDFKPLFEVAATFTASYHSSKELEEEEADAFMENNVGFHVWPYWRELVQSSCDRVGVAPPLEIPMYRIEETKNNSD